MKQTVTLDVESSKPLHEYPDGYVLLYNKNKNTYYPITREAFLSPQNDKIESFISTVREFMRNQNESFKTFEENVNNKIEEQEKEIKKFIENINTEKTYFEKSIKDQNDAFKTNINNDYNNFKINCKEINDKLIKMVRKAIDAEE